MKTCKIILSILLLLSLCSCQKKKDEHIHTTTANLIEPARCLSCGKIVGQPVCKETYLKSFTNNTNNRIVDGIKKIIVSYLDCYYDGLVHLKTTDLSSFFSSGGKSNAYFNQMCQNVTIASRIRQVSDLRMTELEYSLKVIDYIENNEGITVTVSEDSKCRFSTSRDYLTESYDINQTFVLVKEDGKYLISETFRQQDVYWMVQEQYDIYKTSEGNYKNDYNQVYKVLISKFDKLYKENKELCQKAQTEKYVKNNCQYQLDIEKGLKFSYQHVTTKTNPDYSIYGGNCQNFASLILVSAGAKMDYFGNYQWKHFGSGSNSLNEPVGRSPSFTAISQFYKYIKNNTGYGLSGKVDVNMFYADCLDVIGVGRNGGLKHATSVCKRVYIDQYVADILVNSNSGYLVNWPISAYVYDTKVLIKIDGYNQ